MTRNCPIGPVGPIGPITLGGAAPRLGAHAWAPKVAPYTDLMRAHAHDPAHLDVAAFAAAGAQLEGRWPAQDLDRLAQSQTPPNDLGLDDVGWHCAGEKRPAPGAEAELWLHLGAQTQVWLTCQRCLQPVHVPMAIDQHLRFVRGEAQAEALDAESEHDVLALSKSLDLRNLIEDELLLALPLVPRHDVCPQPLPVALGLENDGFGADGAVDVAAKADAAPARPNPFAALRALKRPTDD